jgi:hypothetical protein
MQTRSATHDVFVKDYVSCVSRAAMQRLHVSQPSLRRQIRDLGDEMGVQLLERTAKSVRLTEAGRAFLDEARAILKQTGDAVGKGARDRGQSGYRTAHRRLAVGQRPDHAVTSARLSTGDAEREGEGALAGGKKTSPECAIVDCSLRSFFLRSKQTRSRSSDSNNCSLRVFVWPFLAIIHSRKNSPSR